MRKQRGLHFEILAAIMRQIMGKEEKTMGYETVLFDMDGTLLDTLEDLRDSTNYMLRTLGLPERSLEQMRTFVGNGAEMQMRRALGEHADEETVQRALAIYKPYYEAHCKIKTKPYAGVLPLLEKLKARGIKTAVVSNKPDEAVKKLSEEYFGARMDYAVGPVEGRRCKPWPDMVETALDVLGAEKARTVCVGDSEVDVQTGKNAGLAVIAVEWGFRSRERLIEAGADRIVKNAEELEALLLGKEN